MDLPLNFFLRMVLGHLIGDFILQPFWLAMAKRQGWKGLVIHVLVVTLATGAIIYNVTDDWLCWTFTLFWVHLFIDQFRTFVFTDNSHGKGIILLLLDQAAHILSLMAISKLAVVWDISMLKDIFSYNVALETSIITILCLVIVAIWVAPILEIEFATAVISFNGQASKTIIPIGFSDRLLGGCERLMSLWLSIASFGIFIPFAFVPRFFWLQKHNQSNSNLSTYLKIGTSFVTTLLIVVCTPHINF